MPIGIYQTHTPSWPSLVQGAEKHSCALMVETMTRFHIMWNVWIEGLTPRRDPIDDHSFHALHIIGPCTIDAFLDLLRSK